MTDLSCFSVIHSCVEVYKETVRDLLGDQEKCLRIREHPQNGPYIEGITVTLNLFEI